MAEPAPVPEAADERVLLRSLMHAFYWLDDGLQAHLEREAGISVPRAQSMLMICISEGIERQTDLARRIGVSKQAVQQAMKGLVAKGLVTLEDDPGNGRQRVIRYTRLGQRMRDLARDGLRDLEAELGRRIGSHRLQALHDAVDADWGPVPGSPVQETV